MDNFGLDLGMFDDSLFNTVEVAKESVTKDTSPLGVFSHTYSITPLGVNFNVLLKDKPSTLANLLSLELTSVEGRSRIKEFFLDCDIFIEHMKNRLDDIDEELYPTAIEIYQTFMSNLEYLKRNLNIFDYTSANLGDELKSFETITGNKNLALNKDISIYDLTDRDSIRNLEDDIVNYRYSDLSQSPLHNYHREFSSLLTAHQEVNKLLVVIRLLSLDSNGAPISELISRDILSVNPKLTQDQYINIKSMVDYSGMAYSYEDAEIKAMEHLDFPYTICGRENFLKTDMNSYILNKVKNRSDYTNTAGKTEFKAGREKELLFKLNKSKVYLANKGDNTTMGALYF